MPPNASINKKEKNIQRPPVVVVMGHIDHGKTTLLDRIRRSNVAEKESGGITQHIGAYEVVYTPHTPPTGADEHADLRGKSQRQSMLNPRESALSKGKKITFIDTPGHEAFSEMRSRGAQVADIAILVVAADDGVKPQTVEALETIRKANIPFIIAINKIDKPSADPDRVKKELAEKEVLVEGWGGNVPAVALSAKNGEGIPELLEIILLVAELEELKGDYSKPAEGVVIESHLDPKRGNTATLLIRNGTLRENDFVIAGSTYAPVRIFENFRGQSINEAGPSQPVRIVGFNKLPPVGIPFSTAKSKKEAEEQTYQYKTAPAASKSEKTLTEENENGIHIIPVVLKADTAGSVEAIEQEIKKLEKEKLFIRIVKRGAGSISEDDIKAASSSAYTAVIGFNVKIEREAAALAERFNITVKTFEIIYELIDWFKTHIETTLPMETIEEVIGSAQILKTFSRKGSKQIIGGKVTSGVIKNKAKAKVIRREQVLSYARVLELQQGRTETAEVGEGNEFGMRIDSPIEIAPKDIIEVVEEKSVKKSLSH